MKNDITLARAKNTEFPSLYENFILNNITDNDNIKILSIAIIFLNSEDKYIKQLGYRIITMYSIRTGDYKPLYEVSLNNGYIPIAKFINNLNLYDSQESFFLEMNKSFIENYKISNSYRTVEQKELIEFYNNNYNNSVLAVAPTSYGKTELILSTIKKNENKDICIITPSKSLLSQTRQRILNEDIKNISKVIIHPEMYLGTEKNIIAILTQERLLRLLKMFPDIKFDCVIIDEAHNLLDGKDRNELLASVIILLEKRNSSANYKFLSPFLESEDSIKIKYTKYDIQTFKVLENIKNEYYYIYEQDKGNLTFYDQFLNRTIIVDDNCQAKTDIEFIVQNSLEKNIIYLNKPKDAERFALQFAKKLPNIKSNMIEKVCDYISEYINDNYNLITCIRKGIIYHHGSIPDSIRAYIEKLYIECNDIKYVITTSTLLEGVNIPASRMFLLDNRRGLGNLSRPAFKNLIGRICRFNEIFNNKNTDLKMLEPHIYFVISDYYRKNTNIKSFLKGVAKVDKKSVDNVENVLLENTQKPDMDKLNKSLEFIENFEEATVAEYNGQYAKTEIGKFCFQNNIVELDIVKHEVYYQSIINAYHSRKYKISETKELMDTIYQLFILKINFEENIYDNLKRLKNEKARNFYKMFLDWRMKNASYAEMSATFYKHWEKLIKTDDDTIIYVGKWGDLKRDGHKFLWTDIKNKSMTQKINLAIVRLKDEQDFLENQILKFVEVLNDCEILEETLYLKIKYGTDNQLQILLIKNGLSSGLAKLLSKNYSSYIKVDFTSYEIAFDKNLVVLMELNEENEIHITELQLIILGR